MELVNSCGVATRTPTARWPARFSGLATEPRQFHCAGGPAAYVAHQHQGAVAAGATLRIWRTAWSDCDAQWPRWPKSLRLLDLGFPYSLDQALQCRPQLPAAEMWGPWCLAKR